MIQRFLVIFALLGAAFASAKSYNVTLFQPAMVGDVQLAPGDYKLDVVGDKLVFKGGKSVVAASPVKQETGDTHYLTTTVRFDNSAGKMRIQEVHLGGTSTKLVLAASGTN